MNRILMLSTGGTLASSHSANGLAPGLHGGEILDRISGLTAGFTVVEEELFMLDSSNMQPENWSVIAAHIYERRKEYDGIVVIHGTDTLAYTASALSFALAGNRDSGGAHGQPGVNRESDCGCDGELPRGASHGSKPLPGRLCGVQPQDHSGNTGQQGAYAQL